jgi:hypothetical protein
MPTSNRLVFPHSSTSESVTSRTAVYGPVRTVVWQGSVGDRRPYADQWPVLFTHGYYFADGLLG